MIAKRNSLFLIWGVRSHVHVTALHSASITATQGDSGADASGFEHGHCCTPLGAHTPAHKRSHGGARRSYLCTDIVAGSAGLSRPRATERVQARPT